MLSWSALCLVHEVGIPLHPICSTLMALPSLSVGYNISMEGALPRHHRSMQ